MAEGRVEHAPFAVLADPGQRKIAIGPLDARFLQIHGGFVQPQQDADAVAREILHLVDLVAQNEGPRQVARGGVRGILDDHPRREDVPRMAVEVRADQFAVFGPLVERVDRAVDAEEALAFVADEGQQRGFLFGVELELARGVENDGVEKVEVLEAAGALGDELRVGAQEGVPQSELAAQVVQCGERDRHRIVLKALGLRDHQDLLARRGGLRGERPGEGGEEDQARHHSHHHSFRLTH